LLTAITPTILDVLGLFFGRKNVRLGVNGNTGNSYSRCKVIFVGIATDIVMLLVLNKQLLLVYA